jgi:hypothetical protein
LYGSLQRTDRPTDTVDLGASDALAVPGTYDLRVSFDGPDGKARGDFRVAPAVEVRAPRTDLSADVPLTQSWLSVTARTVDVTQLGDRYVWLSSDDGRVRLPFGDVMAWIPAGSYTVAFGTYGGAGVSFGSFTAPTDVATIDAPLRDVRLVSLDLPVDFWPPYATMSLESGAPGIAFGFADGGHAWLVPGTYGALRSVPKQATQVQLELASSVVIGPDSDMIVPGPASGRLHGTYRVDGGVAPFSDYRTPMLRSPDGATVLVLPALYGNDPLVRGDYQDAFVLAGHYDVLIADAPEYSPLLSMRRRIGCVDVMPR